MIESLIESKIEVETTFRRINRFPLIFPILYEIKNFTRLNIHLKHLKNMILTLIYAKKYVLAAKKRLKTGPLPFKPFSVDFFRMLLREQFFPRLTRSGYSSKYNID